MKQTDKEINRLVKKYPWPDSQELFRSELEYLVILAEKQGMQELAESLKIGKEIGE